ncbi:nitroreductase family protein [Bacillus salacetis]|uniref:nitroreductase family protein n=1 Tax=Bacillus salacetis TaxID=2315464 RepID=UPI003BA2FD60
MAMTKEMIKLEFERVSESEQHARLDQFLGRMKPRRQVKSYSSHAVSEKMIKKAILAAGTSPSGANQQPWSFVLVSEHELKKQIHKALGENESLIETAPYIVALFKQKHGLDKIEAGETLKIKHYYPNESAGICGGFFIAALNQAGLDYNLHKPVKSLSRILKRPENEEAFMLFSIGMAEEYEDSKNYRPVDHISSDIGFMVPSLDSNGMHQISADYYNSIRKRRNVRDFSTEQVDKTLLEKAFSALESSPFQDSYRFAIIADGDTKQKIREKAEQEEKVFYEEKITDVWRDALKPLGTNWEKAHLTDAPFLIIVFKVNNVADPGTIYSQKTKPIMASAVNTGILMSAIHHANLCMLTHTPSPMTFLRELLDRPKNELPIVVVPVGYPAENCEVPNINKKPLEDILTTITEREGETS